MRCPYLKIDEQGEDKHTRCDLFGLDVVWKLDCKKCIESVDARNMAWLRKQNWIKDGLFSLIPKEFVASQTECPYRGDKLEGVTRTENCCGGEVREMPLYECNKKNEPVTEKECSACFRNMQKS